MDDTSRQKDPQYFAAKPADKTAGILLDKARNFFNVMNSNAYLEKINRMWKAYHGDYGQNIGFGHRVEFTGEQGELVQLPVNHFRNLAQHMYTMVTSSRPVMEARAINTDYKSLAQTTVATGVLEYYMREKHLEDCLKKACEMAIVLGSGFIKLEWNATGGEMYDFDEESGVPNYEGELEFTNLSPFDVVVDGMKETWDNDWILTRSFANRFNLIAKYPELETKLLSLPAKSDMSIYRLGVFSNDDTDDIPIYEFYHKRTEALPDGRYILFCEADTVLLDTKLPYRELPVFRIVPSEIMGTPYGYSPMFDIFPLQEAINSLYSTIMTNQNAFGVQNIYVPRGADLAINQLAGSMNILEANAKPEPLNLTQTPAEVFKYLEMLISSAETISGINSVARGNPEASLKSGNALALVQSMAIQFISGLQQSYVKLIEDVGTAVIQILKDFATAPKMIAIVGKDNRTNLKEFTGEDINSIARVIVDMGNPLSHTIAGRVQMAEQLLQMKLIENPQQYFQVINTGRIDSMYEGQQNELLLIKSENENLMQGKSVKALAIDAHKLHIDEHKSVLADPSLRVDQTLVQNTLDHIQDHINLLRQTDPALLQLIGEQPLPPAPGGQNAQGAPSGPPNGSPPNNQPPQGALQNSPNPNVLALNPSQAGGGNQIQGPGINNVSLPSPARPPKPFQNLPMSAAELPGH